MPSEIDPAFERKLRIAGLGLGGLFILWLPFEDLDTAYIVPLSVGINIFLGARSLLKSAAKATLSRYAITGLIAGLLVTPIAVVLIAFKSGLHAHGFPDIALIQIVRLLADTPIWMLAGLVAGLIIGWRVKAVAVSNEGN